MFILTYGRPSNVKTYRTLRRAGWTGRIILLVDDGDPTLPDYLAEFGEQVRVFSKQEYRGRFDMGDNFKETNTVLFARNACRDIALAEGITYYVQLDDDYDGFYYMSDFKGHFTHTPVVCMDSLVSTLLKFYKSIPAATLAIAQGGDFLGGAAGYYGRNTGITRKAMNFFMCSTERPFTFVSRLNDDVSTYALLGNRGILFCSVMLVRLSQASTQQQAGGLTDIYLQMGTYIKSFYTVMFCPSFTRIRLMGYINKRVHHHISWRFAVPKIIPASCKRVR